MSILPLNAWDWKPNTWKLEILKNHLEIEHLESERTYKTKNPHTLKCVSFDDDDREQIKRWE